MSKAQAVFGNKKGTKLKARILFEIASNIWEKGKNFQIYEQKF